MLTRMQKYVCRPSITRLLFHLQGSREAITYRYQPWLHFDRVWPRSEGSQGLLRGVEVSQEVEKTSLAEREGGVPREVEDPGGKR